VTGRLAGLRLKGAWDTWKVVPRVLPYVKPYKLLVAGTLLMSSFGVVIGLAHPWPLAFMVDSVLGNHPPPHIITHLLGTSDRHVLLIFAALAGFGLAAITNGATVLHEYVNTKLQQKVVLDFRTDLFWQAQRLSVSYHDARHTGQLMSQVINESDAGGTLVMSLLPLVESFVMLLGMFAIAFQIDSELALISLAVMPFVYYSVGFYSRRIMPRLQGVRALEWQVASVLFESMAMLRVVAAFAREPHEHSRFRSLGVRTADARVNVTVRQTLFSLCVNTCTAAGTTAVLGVGASHVINGRLTVGELLVLLSYISQVYQPLETISSTIGSLQQTLVAVQGSLILFDTVPDIQDAPDAVPLQNARGTVEFEHVSFRYEGRGETLNDISFAVEPGKRVALVGPTGAGKTTLVSLLMRFYDPSDGVVRVDGKDLRRLKVSSLREQVSVVLQSPELFSGTIAENILYGRLDASMEEMVAAAKAANGHDFIDALPQGYETVLGEGGSRLSVGERQRICIARAFLKDAPILILDEPTSAIDSRTEAVILDSLDELMVGRTTFMIAHRLSTIRHADFILVIHHGELVEQGTHEQLLESGGLYRELYDAQIGSHRLGRRRPGRRRPDSDEALAAEVEAVLAVGGGPTKNGWTADAATLFVRAATEVLNNGSAEALRQLARRGIESAHEVRVAAELARGLLEELGVANGEAGAVDTVDPLSRAEVARRIAPAVRAARPGALT
jgi:ATP-binding cassette, subfamily B, bacterial